MRATMLMSVRTVMSAPDVVCRRDALTLRAFGPPGHARCNASLRSRNARAGLGRPSLADFV